MIHDDGFPLLICAMLRYAAQDYRQGQYWDKKSAEHFLKTDWFVLICEGVNLEPKVVENLVKNVPVRRRLYYD